MQHLANIAALLIILCGCCIAGPSIADTFAEAAVRSACEKGADKADLSGVRSKEMIRRVTIDTCIALERRSADLVEYKRQYLPRATYARCAATGSYTDASECLDRAVLDLPRGSVPGIWRLQNGSNEERIFWDFADCNSARVWGTRGGVCVSD